MSSARRTLGGGRGDPGEGIGAVLTGSQTQRYRNLSVQSAKERRRDVGKERLELMQAAIARDADTFSTVASLIAARRAGESQPP